MIENPDSGGLGFISRVVLRLRDLYLPASGMKIGDCRFVERDDGSGGKDPYWRRPDGTQSNLSDTGGAGSATWTGLTDTPGSISALQFVRGNAGGGALEMLTVAQVIAALDAATTADITTHAALDTGVHGAGSDTLATDADIATHAAIAAAHHDEVTLAADAQGLLNLSTQELGLVAQVYNRVLAGPATPGVQDPTFRALVSADLPTHAHKSVSYIPFGSEPPLGQSIIPYQSIPP